VIRVEVESADVMVRAGLEALMSSSPGLSLAANDDPDVLLASAPLDELSAGAPIVLSEAQRARASKRRNVRLGQLPSAWPFVRDPRISSPPPSRVRRPGL
jgi:hypothetical protein